jgi:protein TonB
MSNRIVALLAALVIPYLIINLVVSLNEKDFHNDQVADKQVNFDVKKQQQIKKPKPKKKPKVKRRQMNQPLPSIKPSNVGSSLSNGGLSFGVPLFDEAEFADIGDGGLLDSFADNTMDRDSVDTPPKVKKRSPIVYPELARRQGVSGYVTMNVLIDESGNVEDVEIVDSDPEEIFDLKADSNIRRWKFEPATYNGKRVKVWAMQKIVFKLD